MLQRRPTCVDEKNAAAAPLGGVFHEQTQVLEHEGERASCRDQLEDPLFTREQCLRSSPLLDVNTQTEPRQGLSKHDCTWGCHLQLPKGFS